MKLSLLTEKSIDSCSFKDLEYGLKLLQRKINRKLIAIDEINRYNQKHNRFRNGTPETAAFNMEIIEIQSWIRYIQDEIAYRLLTVTDDGTVERELLYLMVKSYGK